MKNKNNYGREYLPWRDRIIVRRLPTTPVVEVPDVTDCFVADVFGNEMRFDMLMQDISLV